MNEIDTFKAEEAPEDNPHFAWTQPHGNKSCNSVEDSESKQEISKESLKDTYSENLKTDSSKPQVDTKFEKEGDEDSTSYGQSLDENKQNTQSQKASSPGSFFQEGLNFNEKASTPEKVSTNPRHSLN